MSRKTFRISLILITGLTATLACSLFTPPPVQPAATLDALYTAAAQTLSAMSTQAASTQPAQVTPTSTLHVPTNSPTSFATYTLVPPLQTVVPCDAAAFVTDITYPDGSVVSRGQPFTKTWRVKNTGTCTWTTGYDLVFVSGEKLGGPNAVDLPAAVGPGASVDISVKFTAPNQDGRYRGYWKLRNEAGVQFGFGSSGEATVYIDVNVSGFTVTGYDLAANVCEAIWRNQDKDLPCPGTQGTKDGFALALNAPEMEDGRVRGPGLLTHPQMVNNGRIIGKYPALEIQSGDRFSALIGCLNKANDCNMTFKLDYQVGQDPVQALGQWSEVYEGRHYLIDVDLSFLAGKKVKFILTILSNGSSHEDYGLWVNPRITRQSSKPPTTTPTTTLTPTATASLTATPVTPSATPVTPSATPVTPSYP